MMQRMYAAAIAAAFVIPATRLSAQSMPERGAAALSSALAGLGTTGRVLTVAAHPDDEDTPLIAWLAKGRHVETAYLSLTRGDGGQNLIGNELGEALGAIRTQELLAARRIDGGRQFFTRAYDFGFSKNAEETYRHWPKDSILGDVVRTVRAFRPHVIVAFFSGTPRDGHGHHQVSGLLAREAFEAAADTVRFPVAGFGLPWAPYKFYRSARQLPDSATWKVNTGEYAPSLGRSQYEIAADSRSQHKSQGFGVLQRKGVMWAYLTREAARVGPADPRTERSLFDGIDTSWIALREQLPREALPVLDSALRSMIAVREGYRPDDPTPLVQPLATILRQLGAVRRASGAPPPLYIASVGGAVSTASRPTGMANLVVWDALALTTQRTQQALLLAAGIAVEATAPRRLLPVREAPKTQVNDSLPVTITVFNRGRLPITVERAVVRGVGAPIGRTAAAAMAGGITVAPDSATVVDRWAVGFEITSPWWRAQGRQGHDWFVQPVDARDEVQQQARSAMAVMVTLQLAGERITLEEPIVHRFADPVRGDQQVPVAAVPGLTVNLETGMAYIRAAVPVERTVQVRVQSAYPHPTHVVVQLELPSGLVADSVRRMRTIDAEGAALVAFRVRGTLPEGKHALRAVVTHDGAIASNGAYLVDYPHITPLRLYGASAMNLSAVQVTLPPRARVGYIAGVGDNGIDALQQLDIPVERLDPAMLPSTDLSRFSSIVLGPRAYETHETLVRHNGRLLDYAKAGGTLVVQYGAQNMNVLPVTPYPLQWAPRAERVTLEEAPVRLLQPQHPLLTSPNRITARDWDGWVQERATYMPSRIDPRYGSLLSMNDPDEPENRGALLSTPLGKGRYVYVTLALFRQWPAGVPGAARLLANLVQGTAPILLPRLQ